MTLDFKAQAAALDAEVNANLLGLYRALLRDRPHPVCAHQIHGARDGQHCCTLPAGHIGLHRDAAGCSWGNGDVA